MHALNRILAAVAPRAYDYGVGRAWHLARSLASQSKVDRFLDLGCAYGQLTVEFADAIGAREIHAIELAEECRLEAQSKGILCTAQDLNSRWTYQTAFFDLVLSAHSIEHLHNARICIEECYRCLRPGGRLVLMTPNLSSWVDIAALAMGWQPFSMTNICGWILGNPLVWHQARARKQDFLEHYQEVGASGVVGHVRVLAYAGLKAILQKAGFQEVRVCTRGYPPFWGPVADMMCRLDRRHGHILIGTGLKMD